MSEDNGLYLAISEKSGELVTRENRPIYATRDQWAEISEAIPATLIPTVVNGLPFAALPLLSGGGPDVVGKLFAMLSMLTKATEMVVQRIEILDRRLAETDARRVTGGHHG